MDYLLISRALEDESMDDNRARSNRPLVPTAEVRAARSLRFTSSADSQTRLFWD
jgi:hypothetical protein